MPLRKIEPSAILHPTIDFWLEDFSQTPRRPIFGRKIRGTDLDRFGSRSPPGRLALLIGAALGPHREIAEGTDGSQNKRHRSAGGRGVCRSGSAPPQDIPSAGRCLWLLRRGNEVFGRQYGLSDVSDLYIIPVQGQSKWQIVSKSLGGSPIGTAYITPRSLDQRREQRQREHDALVLQSIQAQDAERAAYQARYEREIADMEALIDKYRNRHGPLSGGIADYLQGVLDDRLARDELLRNMTPESIREELDRIREQQQAGPAVGLGGFDMTPFGGFDDAGDDDLDN